MKAKQPNSLANLVLAKYRITCRAREKIILPPYKGSALHGGFGFGLKAISSFYSKKICQPDSGPNPYILLPPLDRDTQYQQGHTFSFEFTLLGSAVDYFPVCRDAIAHLGNQLGLGKNRGKFEITAIDNAVPPDPAGNTVQSLLIRADSIASSRTFANPSKLTLHLVTPLRLKANDRVMLEPPSFSIFFARMIGRLNSLATFHGDGAIISPEEKHKLLEQAKQIRTVKEDIYRKDLNRFSTRQKQWMKFDGLLGQIMYEGDLKLFLPYLAVGEWVHVGGKTSFGLGKYVLDSNSQ